MNPPAIIAFIAVVAAFAASLTLLPLLLPLLLHVLSLPLTTMSSSSFFLTLASSASFSFPSTRLVALWLVRLCAHRLVTHTVAKFYVKKSLRAVHAFVVRRAALMCGWEWRWEGWGWRWGTSRWWWWWWCGASCAACGEALRSAWLGAENDPDVAVAAPEHEWPAVVAALAAALDAARDVVAGAEPPVRWAALERRRSIDAVVAGCVG
ncbi:hypothetical protein IWX90DRAFT_481202 [Phyllosticta citrichinensis]|uniref:Uncharacterized protein n=1 Tax=Phyllosticta citrichinensis TaxID=1130410 RepID=A0ABR1XHK6_9PEZI